MKLSTEDKKNKFIEKSIQKWGYKYDYSKVDYIDYKTPVTIIYKNISYSQTPTKHLQGKKIELQEKRIPTNSFIIKSKEIWGDRFNYDECEYLGTNNKIKLYDNLKNKWIEQNAKSHLNGYEVVKYTKEEYISNCNLIHDFKFNYNKINYENLHSKITINCEQHGDFELKASSHLNSYSSCPNCYKTSGEKVIMKILKSYNINFNRQHKFPDCNLPFDFYIPSIRIIIDFIDKNNFDTNFEYYNQLKINDKIKNDYCEDNYINLIRIKYTDINNIKTILNPILRLKH